MPAPARSPPPDPGASPILDSGIAGLVACNAPAGPVEFDSLPGGVHPERATVGRPSGSDLRGAAMPSLHVLKGPNEGAIIPLDGDRFVLGRNPDCGIVIPVTSVSREHALILRIQGKFFIEDKQ